MNLSKTIKQYYFDHFDQLPEDKRFHFASRLAAWQGDYQALSFLKNFEAYMNPSDSTRMLRQIIDQPVNKRVYAYDLRKKYFEKYPELYGLHNAMFRIRHVKEIYGTDLRENFLKIVSAEEIVQLYQRIIVDGDALCILSRFAVDFIYMYEVLFDRAERFDPQIILHLGSGYDLTNQQERHLFIYLYCHSIIGDTNFYLRQVPTDRLPIYKRMLQKLEALIKSYQGIKLDNKFEFLVACRICNVNSALFNVVNSEAKNSLSSEGCFIIDKLNGASVTGLNSFARSEHRNVLYIMSTSTYAPRSVLVK